MSITLRQVNDAFAALQSSTPGTWSLVRNKKTKRRRVGYIAQRAARLDKDLANFVNGARTRDGERGVTRSISEEPSTTLLPNAAFALTDSDGKLVAAGNKQYVFTVITSLASGILIGRSLSLSITSSDAAGMLGRLGGLAGKGKTSERKKLSSRRNGKLGGRNRRARPLPAPIELPST